MNCPESLELLQRLLDGQTPGPSTALDRHLAECSDCRERFAAAYRLLDALPTHWTDATDPAHCARLAEQVLADRSRRTTRRRWLAGLALAASMLLAVGLYPWLRAPYTPYSTEPVAKRPLPPPSLLPGEDTPFVTQSLREAQTELASFTERMAGQAGDQARLLPLAMALPFELLPASPVPLERPLATSTQSLQQTALGVSNSMQPVNDITRRAMNYFLRKMPPGAPRPAAEQP